MLTVLYPLEPTSSDTTCVTQDVWKHRDTDLIKECVGGRICRCICCFNNNGCFDVTSIFTGQNASKGGGNQDIAVAGKKFLVRNGISSLVASQFSAIAVDVSNHLEHIESLFAMKVCGRVTHGDYSTFCISKELRCVRADITKTLYHNPRAGYSSPKTAEKF